MSGETRALNLPL